jgi:hypothetical protein
MHESLGEKALRDEYVTSDWSLPSPRPSRAWPRCLGRRIGHWRWETVPTLTSVYTVSGVSSVEESGQLSYRVTLRRCLARGGRWRPVEVEAVFTVGCRWQVYVLSFFR